MLTYISGSGWVQLDAHIHWNWCWFWPTYLLHPSEGPQLLGKPHLSHLDQWFCVVSWAVTVPSRRTETPTPSLCSQLPPGLFLAFSTLLSPPNTLMQTFYVFTYLAQSGSSWFVFKVPSELPLVCVLRITNDYGLWCPNSFQMGSVHMVAWVWDQPFSVLAQAVGIWTWRTEISQHRGGKLRGFLKPWCSSPIDVPKWKLILSLPWARMPGMLCNGSSFLSSPF